MLAGAGTLVAAAYFLDWWWPAMSRSAPGAYDLLAERTSVPNWLLGLLVGMALLFTGGVINGLLSRRPRWSAYTEDTFFGLVWRWRYSIVVGDGVPVDLTPFCPHCDFQLQPDPAADAGPGDGITYRCDSCGRALESFDGSAFALQRKIERLIERRIRHQGRARPASPAR
jgi:hypothetical protein